MTTRNPAAAMSPYFHVRKEDVHAGSARDANPSFESFDVVLRRDYDELRAGLEELLDVATRWISGDKDLDPERWYAARDYARKVLAGG